MSSGPTGQLASAHGRFHPPETTSGSKGEEVRMVFLASMGRKGWKWNSCVFVALEKRIAVSWGGTFG